MHRSTKGLSTGPKTKVGKANASKNARKAAIFSKAYLDWEDVDRKRQEFSELASQWGAHDPSRQMILRSIEHAMICQERLMYSEKKRIEGLMMSSNISRVFCARAGGFEITDSIQLPAWYFTENSYEPKKFALFIMKVRDQAAELKAKYSHQLMAQVKEKYLDLYAYVKEERPATEPFGIALSQRYRLAMPTLNLQAVVTEIEKEFKVFLKWARDPERYEVIIAGIRAEQMQEGMDFDKSTRYATNFQNRVIKGFTALAALDQHEQQQLSAVSEELPDQLFINQVVDDDAPQ